MFKLLKLIKKKEQLQLALIGINGITDTCRYNFGCEGGCSGTCVGLCADGCTSTCY